MAWRLTLLLIWKQALMSAQWYTWYISFLFWKSSFIIPQLFCKLQTAARYNYNTYGAFWKFSCHSLHIISSVNADCSSALIFFFDLQPVLKQTNFLLSTHIHTPTSTQRQKASDSWPRVGGVCVGRPEWAVALATYFEPERAVHVRQCTCMCIIFLVRVILT